MSDRTPTEMKKFSGGALILRAASPLSKVPPARQLGWCKRVAEPLLLGLPTTQWGFWFLIFEAFYGISSIFGFEKRPESSEGNM
jgi:hypothetical protein